MSHDYRGGSLKSLVFVFQGATLPETPPSPTDTPRPEAAWPRWCSWLWSWWGNTLKDRAATSGPRPRGAAEICMTAAWTVRETPPSLLCLKSSRSIQSTSSSTYRGNWFGFFKEGGGGLWLWMVMRERSPKNTNTWTLTSVWSVSEQRVRLHRFTLWFLRHINQLHPKLWLLSWSWALIGLDLTVCFVGLHCWRYLICFFSFWNLFLFSGRRLSL